MPADTHREGYGVFVRCPALSAATPAGEFVAIIEALDRILFEQIGETTEDFFPNPFGGAIYRREAGAALEAARALVSGLSESGTSAGIGIAWGRFQRTANVHDWNAAALPLNEAARLAFCEAAVGRVLVSPHVRNNAGARAEFSDERVCSVKGKDYRYHAIESAGYQQRLASPVFPATPQTFEKNIVLWDIVKYSTKNPDEQADLSGALALRAATVLQIFGAKKEDYSPTGDGGFAVFDTGLQALAFAKELGRYAASKDITIRTGINHGEVAFSKRGLVGPGVLGADAISALAPDNGVAILADVWHSLDSLSQADWQPGKTEGNILMLEAKPGVVAPAGAYTLAPTARDRNILVNALSDIAQFQTPRDRQTFIRMVLSEHPFADAAHETLRFLDWTGGALVVADNLVWLLEGQEAAPGLPAMQVIAEAIEPAAGMAHREKLVDLRRRLKWGA